MSKIKIPGLLRCTLIATVTSLFLFSCHEIEQRPVDPANSTLTKLGKKTENPFSLANMALAIENVSKKSKTGRTKLLEPSTTHNYVRFAPQNETQLVALHDLGYDLYDVPLDRDIAVVGEYYQDPSLPASAITYQYTLVPANYGLPATVPYTILTQVYLFNDDAGDEQDPETDPWNPQPGPGGYCYDEDNQAYVCGTNPRRYVRMKNAPPKAEDLYQKATRELIAAGLSPREVYNEAMRLAGYPEEVIETLGSGRTQTRYYASGYVKVVDNATNMIQPVRNVQVKTRRFFKIDYDQTDNTGYFEIDKGYRKKASVILKFTNNRATVRGISGALKLWEYAQVLEKEVGQFEGDAMVGMNITLQYNSNADTYTALQWSAAHCLNTLELMYDYTLANTLGQNPYQGMNIWISSAITQAASTPMLRAIVDNSQLVQGLRYLFPNVQNPTLTFLQRWLPDITYRHGGAGINTRSANLLSGTLFHEFGHTQHYSRVGNSYWYSYIWYIVTNGGYGTKTTPGVGRVAVGEAWAYYVGPTFNRTKYSGNAALAAVEYNFLEFQKRNDNVAVQPFNGTVSEGWIPWGMLHDMTDTGEPAVTLISDGVNGYSMYNVFRGFNSGVETVPALRDAMLYYNGYSQQPSVNLLTASYGW
jgi:hypothetical protein